MERPFVSIILTCYNFESYIEQCVSSLLNQSLDAKIEIIIVDDASTDNSPLILKKLADQNNNIKFIHHLQNKGAAYSINEAFSFASGKYLCRFDGDDVWHTDFLKRMTDVLENNPEVSLAYCNCSYINNDGKITNKDVLTRRKAKEVIANEFDDLLVDYYITAPTILFRKSSLDPIFPVPENYNFLDWYVSLCVSLKYPCYFLNETLAFYRIHENGMHVLMIANKKGEETTFNILNNFHEKSIISTKKLKNLKSIYYRNFSFNYFGKGLFKDTKRSIINYIKNDIRSLADIKVMRLLIGCYLGGFYPKIKKVVKKINT